MGLISFLNSLPRSSRIVLLAGIVGIVSGTLGIKFSHDVSWIKFFDNLHWTSATSAAAVLAWLGLRTPDSGSVVAHTWFAIGLTGYAIGQVMWDIQVALGYSDFPGPADLFYLWLGPSIAYGLLIELLRLSKPNQKIFALLDVTALTVAVVTFVLAAYLPQRGSTGLLPLVVLILYPATLFTASCVGLAMTIELRLRLSWTWVFFLLSLVVTALSWMKWNMMALGGAVIDGAWFNVSFSVAVLVLGLAINRWQAEQSSSAAYDRYCESMLRLLPLLTVVMACLAIILTIGMHDISEIVEQLINVAAPVVILLAMTKQVLLLRERDQLIEVQAALVHEEEALRTSEERFRTLAIATTQMVWTTNAQGEMTEDHPAWRAYTGQSIADSKGWGWAKAIHPEDAERSLAAWRQSLIAHTQYEAEFRLRRHDGVYCYFSVRGVPVFESDGNVREWIGTCTDITEFKQSEEMIWRQANFDALTGLPNRRMFRDRLEQEAKKSDRTGLPLAFLLIDLDQFKEVNDTLGHDVGDVLLQEAAQRISECVRDTDTVARLGGDEFTVILSELPDTSDIEDTTQKIIGRLAEPYYLGEEVAYVSASIGITLYPNDSADIDVLMKNADQAMYVAKSKGRNCFSYFTQILQESAQVRMHLTNDLRQALEAGQLSVYFQPIIELSTGSIHKAEALLRWRHPAHGMISPMEFIPLAETAGLINEIGDWVFRESVDWVRRWNHRDTGGFQISVNMSPVQFHSRSNSTETWGQCLKLAELPGSSIVIEITEGLLLNAEVIVMNRLLMFRDLGIEVAIDDFGTGYSALSYLKKFHIDYLKIDRSFTRDLEMDEEDVALCEAIIVMAHKLGLKVIAEGVETEGQRKMLLAMGCDYAQGYLYAKPMPAEEFEKFLAIHKSL